MKKVKKTKVPVQHTELGRIAKQLRTMLRCDTISVIEKGKLLLRSRELLEEDTESSHGKWQAWLAENFDLSYHTARNYVNAAKYVARQKLNRSIFGNLAPSVLYHLAQDHFVQAVEAAILAEARERRVDEDAMWAIREKLEPPDDDTDDADDQEDGGEEDRRDNGDEKDAESEAILDGPPPAVPPTADPPPPTNFALRDFNKAVCELRRLMGKPSAQFVASNYTVNDLQSVEDFLRAVREAKTMENHRSEVS